MKPKKRLGQNFLINVNAARRIASLLELAPGEPVLEIGGGQGALTKHLLATGAKVTTVELDAGLAQELKQKYGAHPDCRIVRSDILQLTPQALFPHDTKVKLIGNIPYNLTTPILEWTVEHRDSFPLAVIMVQKEVADRITAPPGGKDFGALSIFVQLFYRVEKVFSLKPGSFYPSPKVASSVVRFYRLERDAIRTEQFLRLRRLTSACFRWRRKQIVRILRDEYSMEQQSARELLDSLSIAYAARPEQLAVAQYIALVRKIECLDSGSS